REPGPPRSDRRHPRGRDHQAARQRPRARRGPSGRRADRATGSRHAGTRGARSLRERTPGGAGALAPAQGARLRESTGARDRVRQVDITAEAYQMLAAYMIRLTRADLENPEQVRALARAGALDEAALLTRFAGLVAPLLPIPRA